MIKHASGIVCMLISISLVGQEIRLDSVIEKFERYESIRKTTYSHLGNDDYIVREESFDSTGRRQGFYYQYHIKHGEYIETIAWSDDHGGYHQKREYDNLGREINQEKITYAKDSSISHSGKGRKEYYDLSGKLTLDTFVSRDERGLVMEEYHWFWKYDSLGREIEFNRRDYDSRDPMANVVWGVKRRYINDTIWIEDVSGTHIWNAKVWYSPDRYLGDTVRKVDNYIRRHSNGFVDTLNRVRYIWSSGYYGSGYIDFDRKDSSCYCASHSRGVRTNDTIILSFYPGEAFENCLEKERGKICSSIEPGNTYQYHIYLNDYDLADSIVKYKDVGRSLIESREVYYYSKVPLSTDEERKTSVSTNNPIRTKRTRRYFDLYGREYSEPPCNQIIIELSEQGSKMIFQPCAR